MKRLLLFVAICTLAESMAFAQASGNFDAAVTSAACAIDPSKIGGLSNPCGLSGQPACPILDTTISTSSGNGVTLVITPSAVTGLLTDTKVSATTTSASAEIGVQVCVEIDGSGANVLPNDGNGNACVVYDQRFQQLSATFFTQLTECVAVPCTTVAAGATDACTTAGEGVCVPTTPGAPAGSPGTCSLPNPLCTLDLLLTTLSAHSFNFIAQVPNGPHNVHADFSLVGVTPTNANSNVAACVGPGTLTVTQAKIFHNSGSTLTF